MAIVFTSTSQKARCGSGDLRQTALFCRHRGRRSQSQQPPGLQSIARNLEVSRLSILSRKLVRFDHIAIIPRRRVQRFKKPLSAFSSVKTGTASALHVNFIKY